jgi:MFS family permease
VDASRGTFTVGTNVELRGPDDILMTMQPPTPQALGAPHDWLPHEKPSIPGSPGTPLHSTRRRVAYAAVGSVLALTGGLGNALVSANLINLQGPLGVFTNQIVWLPTVYVMTNISMNLLLVKFRQQYGIRLFAELGMLAYIAVSIGHLFVNDFRSALAVRAFAGIAAAPLSTLGLYYWIQAVPAAHRVKGIVAALGVGQLATPLARLISSDLLQIGAWNGLYLFELGLALVCYACFVALRLPPSDRIKVFEPLDFLTFGLFAPGAALLSAVLGVGRYEWWTEAPWLGWALAGAIALLTAALIIEHNRKRPLIDTRWLASGDLLRIALAIILVRVVLSEQTVGAVGMLQTLGLNNDQFYGLFAIILAASIVGFAMSAWLLDVNNIPRPVLIALALITVGSLMDARSTSLTRPENVYLSQAMIAFAGAIFLAPALMAGFTRVIQKGYAYLASFSVLFSITQSLGGLAGTAALGTLQVIREKYHSNQLAQAITTADPQTVLRLQQLGGAYAKVLGDASLRGGEASVLLGQQVTREANILAYDDVFRVFAVISAATFVWIAIIYARAKLRARAAQGASA